MELAGLKQGDEIHVEYDKGQGDIRIVSSKSELQARQLAEALSVARQHQMELEKLDDQ